MAVSEYHLDTRIRRKHVPLLTQQRRLRHLRSVSARNVLLPDPESELALEFSLHKNPRLPAFYTSEVVTENGSPSWKDFESSNFPETVDTASSHVTVKVWNALEKKQLLIEWVVFFSGLVFLGEQIPKEGKNFKPSTLILGMSEGYYGCSDCYQHIPGNLTEAQNKDTLLVEATGLRTSCTLSTLSRIKTVERAIKQTQAAVQRRRDSIGAKLAGEQVLLETLARRELHRIRISVLRGELHVQERNLHSLEQEITSYREHLMKKRNEIAKKAEEQKILSEKCSNISRGYCEFRENLLKTEAQLNFRRKQLMSELSCVYPLVEFPDGDGFNIQSVHLPNSEYFSGHDETKIAIALGYVCHIVLMIAQFLNVPLRYSINFYGSRSTILDHISSSLPDKTREFPLYSKGKDRRCFEYGVFLLNKNLAQLRIFLGLVTKDLSATLPNLSSLIKLRLSINNESFGMPSKPAAHRNSRESPGTMGSEIEMLRQEVEAMMPPLVLPQSPELSTSLDRGLDDIKLMERSPKVHTMHLKLTHHHSSHPNLNVHPQLLREDSKFYIPAEENN